MPGIVVPADQIALGPGYLLWAPLASTLPSNTVAGSIFTDAWPGAWIPLGITDNGHEFDYSLKVDEVDAEEYLDPIKYVTSGRTTGMKFAMAQITATNWKRAFNGGTATVTGTAATTLTALTPPPLGSEVRCMIGWESTDNTERLIATQCFQFGALSTSRQKGAAKATIPVEFRFEQPPAGAAPFTYYSAGVGRA